MQQQNKRMSAYVADLLAAGRIVFSSAEAEQALGIRRAALLKRAERLQKQGKLYSPRRGYYVIVPPQFLNWGAPPTSWFIDDLMRHEDRLYYIGLLKAAELHGASHQAVMEFQVVTNARLPRLRAGRSVVAFYYRRDIAGLSGAIEDCKTETGKMRISSPELTAFDLLRYPGAAGGLDNILTVLTELGARLDGSKLAALCPRFERSVGQRLGYLLARAGQAQVAEALLPSLVRDQLLRWIELDPAQAGDPDLSPAPVERDSRWRVIVRRIPEADQQ